MTIDEAKEKCRKLGTIAYDFNFAPDANCKSEARAKFKQLSHEIHEGGFDIKHRSLRVQPTLENYAKLYYPRASGSNEHVTILDMRPAGCNIQGDCTTRCISYCLGKDYWEVRREQDRRSLERFGRSSHWNDNNVWDKCLSSRGWKEIVLKKPITRMKLGPMLKSLEAPIATLSSGHVAAMHKGKTIDSWHSERGRVTSVMVPNSQLDAAKRMLGSNVLGW